MKRRGGTRATERVFRWSLSEIWILSAGSRVPTAWDDLALLRMLQYFDTIEVG